MPIFMRITSAEGDDIDGEGVFPEHPNWMFLDSFSFGKPPSDTMQASWFDLSVKQRAAELEKTQKEKEQDEKDRRAKYYDTHVTVQRMFDVASPALMTWLLTGDERKVEFDHCTQDGVSMFKLTLEAARLTDYSTSSQRDNGIPETLKISWEKFEIATAELGPDGKPRG